MTTAADVLATSVSAEALLLSPTVIGEVIEADSLSSRSATTVLMAEVASSPMSPITLTSVEINENPTEVEVTEANDRAEAAEAAEAMEAYAINMSPSRFSSNSINTVILNPGAVSLTSTGSHERESNSAVSSPYRESQNRT